MAFVGHLLVMPMMALSETVILSDLLIKRSDALLSTKQLVEQAYSNLGYQVQWQLLPGARSLKLSNAGEIDGEFVRSEAVAQRYPNLVKVPVPLIASPIYLFCKNKQACLSPTQNTVVGYNKNLKIFEQFCLLQQYVCYPFGSTKQLFDPLLEDRVDAFLATQIEVVNLLSNDFPTLYRVEVDKRVMAFHYVNKKHQNRVEPLVQQFRLIAKNKRLTLPDTLLVASGQFDKIVDLSK